MKTLVSWLAFVEDFTKEGSNTNQDGPHLKFYKHHLESLNCNKHVLLANSDEDEVIKDKHERLFQSLHRELRRFDKRPKLIKETIPLNDAWDVAEIFQRLEKYLLDHRDEQFVAMINTGTRDMQTAWYLLAARYPEKLELVKVKHPTFSEDKEAGDIDRGVKLNESILPSAFTVRSAEKGDSQNDFVDFQTEARQRARDIAASPDTTVLILGEHGTGKESLARTVHDESIRRKKPYEVRNCAGYTDELLRSELFGHKKGAFTGADKDKKGLFEEAKGGTVFLDEIGDISAFMQVSLLRVLQNKETMPIGGNEAIKIDVRIIAATNKDLLEACGNGLFRWDLYYRLSVAEIHTRPLRSFDLKEKRKVIEHFTEHAYRQKFKGIGKKKIQLNKPTKAILDAYDFPGNIREIENLIESLYTFPQEEISPEMLPNRMQRLQKEIDESMDAATRRHAKHIYRKYGENKKRALEVLEIGSTNTLNKYLKD